MARKLTKAQKDILDKINYEALDFDDLPNEVCVALLRLNDYETLWSDVNRYLWDKATEARYGKK